MSQPLKPTLRITEIFYSIQGETSLVGLPTVFVRLTGCPLRCVYCDTSYAFFGGKKQSIEDIVEKINSYGASYVTVTGGEPLSQPNVLILLEKLLEYGLTVSLETSGALSASKVPSDIIKIVDFKTPSSQEESKNLYENIQYLNHYDEVKIVIGDRNDYIWAKDLIKKYNLIDKCQVLFSPVYLKLQPDILADWVLEDRLQVKMQVQLHKYIWGDIPGK